MPKGVALSHANLLANIRAFGEAFAFGADDVGVTWLPLYHDMGLIGTWFGPLYHGVPAVVMSPLAFLSRPVRWLEAVHTHRGTLSAAPNFAYDLCARKITDAELEGLDLSSWRCALNGAEAVIAATIERFTTRFAPYGFRPERHQAGLRPGGGQPVRHRPAARPRSARRSPVARGVPAGARHRAGGAGRPAAAHVRRLRPPDRADTRSAAWTRSDTPVARPPRGSRPVPRPVDDAGLLREPGGHRRRRPRRTAGWTRAISGTSRTAISSSPAARRTSSSPAAATSIRRRSKKRSPRSRACGAAASRRSASRTRGPAPSVWWSCAETRATPPPPGSPLHAAVTTVIVETIGVPADVVVFVTAGQHPEDVERQDPAGRHARPVRVGTARARAGVGGAAVGAAGRRRRALADPARDRPGGRAGLLGLGLDGRSCWRCRSCGWPCCWRADRERSAASSA